MSETVRKKIDYAFHVPEQEIKVVPFSKKTDKGMRIQLFHIHDVNPSETTAIENVILDEELSKLPFEDMQKLFSYELNKVTFSNFRTIEESDFAAPAFFGLDGNGFLCAHPLLTNYKETMTGIIQPAMEEWYYYQPTKRWHKSLAVYAHKGELRVDDLSRRTRIARFDLWGQICGGQDRVPTPRNSEISGFLLNLDIDRSFNYEISSRTLDNKPLHLLLSPATLHEIKADRIIINPRKGLIVGCEQSYNQDKPFELSDKTLRDMNAFFHSDVQTKRRASSLETNYLGFFVLEALGIALPKQSPSQPFAPCPQAVEALKKFGLK